jgi:hypothetical protein
MKVTINKKQLLKKVRRRPGNRSLATRVHESIKRYKRAKQKRKDLKEIKENL